MMRCQRSKMSRQRMNERNRFPSEVDELASVSSFSSTAHPLHGRDFCDRRTDSVSRGMDQILVGGRKNEGGGGRGGVGGGQEERGRTTSQRILVDTASAAV